MSLVIAAISYRSRIVLQSKSINAVFPDPTGPPMPMRSGPWDLDISNAHSVTSSRPVISSSRRTPGPITTGGCIDKRCLATCPTDTTRRMGPRFRGDDKSNAHGDHHHDLNNLVYCVSCRMLARSARKVAAEMVERCLQRPF